MVEPDLAIWNTFLLLWKFQGFAVQSAFPWQRITPFAVAISCSLEMKSKRANGYPRLRAENGSVPGGLQSTTQVLMQEICLPPLNRMVISGLSTEARIL